MEAKQIRSEVQEKQQTHIPITLPISQIQSLIRAGAIPRVCGKIFVERSARSAFLASVETEKQYAIEQFLAVPAPKESRVRTLSELIERTFAAARVRLEDVTWKATRLGLEPWKISAQFVSSGHTICAEWSWNMHDNAVSCLNSAARKLIGEQDAPKEGHAEKHADENFLASLNLPGNSPDRRESNRPYRHGTRLNRPCRWRALNGTFRSQSRQSACLTNSARRTHRVPPPTSPYQTDRQTP